MNTFGRLFRITIFGESHGRGVGLVIDGCPAGLELTDAEFASDLGRRKGGAPGTTARVEADVPRIMSGVFDGRTTGAPILVYFDNRDIDSSHYETLKHTPRPGHADFVAHEKYGGFNDYRGGGFFSGRLTTPLVAAGVIAKKLLAPLQINAKLLETGGSGDIDAAVAAAVAAGDSVGGIVECRVNGLPVGLGEPFFDPLEALISHIVFAIPGVKGIEFGAGFRCSAMRGSEYNDPIIARNGTTRTNHCGGINGGITNGNELVYRVAIRPTASIAKEQDTIDLRTGESAKVAVQGRHDACIALRVPVIVEAATAIVLADCMILEQRIPNILKRG